MPPDPFDAIPYFGQFWWFIINRQYREHCFKAWRESSGRDRLFLAIEASVCTLCGLGPLLLVSYWLAG